MLLSVPLVTFNVEYLDYCLESTVRCAMDLADEVVVNDGNSTDGTMDALLSLQNEYGKDRIRIERRAWRHDFFWEEKERNYAASLCKGDWIFFFDVDECFHEDSLPRIRAYLETAPKEVICVRFPQLNFYGTKDFIHPRTEAMPFLPKHVKIGRKENNFRIQAMTQGNPAELVADLPNGTSQLHGIHSKHVHDLSEDLYHYSWARDARAQGVKRRKIGSWVNSGDQNPEFFDGYLPKYEEVPFSYDMSNPQLIRFKGQHPKYMESWFSKRDRLLDWKPGQ